MRLVGVSGKFVDNAKDKLEVTLTANGTSYCDPHANYRHIPDLESENDLEGTSAGPDAHSAVQDCIVASVSSIMSCLPLSSSLLHLSMSILST